LALVITIPEAAMPVERLERHAGILKVLRDTGRCQLRNLPHRVRPEPL
jgi:hypothetical protein